MYGLYQNMSNMIVVENMDGFCMRDYTTVAHISSEIIYVTVHLVWRLVAIDM